MTQFKRTLSIFTLTITAMMFYSCEKGDQILEAFSEGDAAEIIESSLDSNVGGLTSNFSAVANQLLAAIDSGDLCDSLYTDTIISSYQGLKLSADYNTEFSYNLVCNPLGNSQSAAFYSHTKSLYNTTRIYSNDSANFNGSVSGLQASSVHLLLNGSYNRTGSQELNFKESKNITSIFSVTLTDLKIKKQGGTVVSGSGTFTFSGTAPNNSFSYSGSIIFNGNNTGTLTMGAETYDMDWN